MKPNWVLSDEQCNIRFRNMRKEKNSNVDKQMQREGTSSEEFKIEIKEESASPDQGNRVEV